MIPVALPSVEWLLTVGGLLLLSIIWVIWSLLLIFSATSRKRLVNLRLVIYLLCTAVTVFLVYRIYIATVGTQQAMQKLQKEHYPELSHPQRIGQIEMPAQTKLYLEQANKLESFQQAEFPHPVKIGDIAATKVERYLAYQFDKENHNKVTAMIPEGLSVTGKGTTQQAGWLCDASLPVKFALHADGAIAAFEGCQLAEGNRVEGIAIPPATKVMPSTGNTWSDGFVDQDRWMLDTWSDSSSTNIVEIDGLPLVEPWIYLDENRQIYMITRAELARTVTFGGITHPKGTLVNLNPRTIREHYTGAWIFSTPTHHPERDLEIISGGSAEMNSDTETQKNEHNIVQDRAGHVLARDISF